MPDILLTLLIFHFEISGNSFKDEHPKNIPDILLALHIFHLEISGNSFKDEHP